MMEPNSIPIRLTLVEICVTALMEAADGLDRAHDVAAFLDALEDSHVLWLAVQQVGARNGWAVPSPRDAEFVILCSSRLGRGVTDADVEALVTINRRVAQELAANGDIARIRTRVRQAYREDGGSGFVPWLQTQMNKKDRLRSLAAPTAERGANRPAIASAWGRTPG